ncbi:MAG: hypothetical protein ACXAC6_17090 [Candidatus Hodarchaeales archaeon]
MKRWATLICRGGTILMSIGLALLFVSLIPPAQTGSSGGTGALPSEFFQDTFGKVLTPQQDLDVNITANGTLTIYILEVSTQTIYDWMDEYSYDHYNITGLEEFLSVNSDLIAFQGEMKEVIIKYTPTEVTNVTVILLNPSSVFVLYDLKVSISTIMAPETRTQNLALWTIPAGFALTLPWLFIFVKERRAPD